MSDLTSLIERIEAATGPDRILDIDVFREIGTPLPTEFMERKIELEWDETDLCFVMPLDGMRIRYEPPFYTTSIDAALTLLPEGWRCGFEHAGVADSDQRPLAWCWPFGSSWEPDWQLGCDSYKGHDRGVQAAGATAPLALLAAFLRARQTEGHHDES